MMIFSPSSREEYSFCPRKFFLRKQGWQTRRVGYPELCGIGGSAVSEAMCQWNRQRINNQPSNIEELVATGLQYVATTIAELASIDRRITGLKDLEFADMLCKYVETGIRTLWQFDVLKQHRIVAAEHEYVDFGNARLDVVSYDPNNELCVDDYKCKFGEFDDKWLDREFDKHFDGEQRLAYTNMTQATLFGIILVLIRPMKQRKPMQPCVIRRVSRVQPHEHRLWRNDATLHYQQMEQVLERSNPWMVPGKAAPHANQYGDCPYREACVEDNLDYSKMKVRYVQITKEVPNDEVE